jgi:hypothetical protein
MVFNATDLLMKETGENHRPAASHWQALSYNVVSSIPRLNGIRTGFIEGYILLPDIFSRFVYLLFIVFVLSIYLTNWLIKYT